MQRSVQETSFYRAKIQKARTYLSAGAVCWAAPENIYENQTPYDLSSQRILQNPNGVNINVNEEQALDIFAEAGSTLYIPQN